MWTDFQTLASKEIKILKRDIRYWLGLLGVDRESSKAYQAYVIAFWGFWLFTLVAFGVDQVRLLSDEVRNPELLDIFTRLMPLSLTLLILVYLVYLYRNPPLKMRSADLHYIAPAPVSRPALIWVYFIRQQTLLSFLVASFATLIALFFAWNTRQPDINRTALQIFAVSFFISYAVGALGWGLALHKQNTQARYQPVYYLVTIPLVLFGCWLLPDIFLSVGHVWLRTLTAPLSGGDVALILGMMLVCAVTLYTAGSRLLMPRIMDASQLYARVQRLGVFGPIIAADVIAQIQKQARLAKMKRPRGHLPRTRSIPKTLMGRVYIATLRPSPLKVFQFIRSGFILPSIVIGLLRIGGAESLQIWLLVFILIIQLRPRELIQFFSESLQQPFLRQFTPVNNWTLFFSQTAFPFAFAMIGVLSAVLIQFQTFNADIFSVLCLAVASLFMVSVCLALEHVRFSTHMFARNALRYEYAVLFCASLMILGGALTQSLWVALVISLLLIGLLTRLLYFSRST